MPERPREAARRAGVRGAFWLTGAGVGAAAPLLEPEPDDRPVSRGREIALAALNGVVGDHLAETGNTSDRITLYEIAKLRPETERALNAGATRETVQLAGKTWHRAIRLDSLVDGEPKVLEFPGLYAVLLRKGEEIFAFNNACPHLKLPFFEPTPTATVPTKSATRIDDEGVIKCRWHESRFDLTSGEIVSWCEALNDAGMSPVMPMLGDISKNRAPLNLIPWREGRASRRRAALCRPSTPTGMRNAQRAITSSRSPSVPTRTIGASWSGKIAGKSRRLPTRSCLARKRSRMGAWPLVRL